MRFSAVSPARHPEWTIEATAVALGGYAWVEQRLYEVLGGLVTPGPGGEPARPEVALMALAHARHHAWHAELWRARIPNLAHLGFELLVAPPSDEVRQALDSLAGGAEAQTALVGLYRGLLPDLVDTYARHLAGARPVTDGPVMRSLELVLADERRDCAEGEDLLVSVWGRGA
ncbi:MAG: hypothetical protein ACRDY2_03415 [Acidimicrobiales bacterium]